MNVVIIGRGAIGLLLSHFLRSQKISCKIRQSKLNNEAEYFTFTNLLGKSEQQKYRIADQQTLASAEVIICCVKSYDVKAAIASIKDTIAKDIPIILAHNGMGVVEDMALLNLKNPLYGLLTTMGARRLSRQHVMHTGSGSNKVGLISNTTQAYDNQSHLKTIDTVTKLQHTIKVLGECLPQYQYCHNFYQLQWQKLAINCAINALTAIHNVANGALMEKQYRQTIEKIINELVDVAKLESIDLKAEMLLNEVFNVVRLTAINSSSMREDIKNKRQTEIEYINGYIVALGRKHNIATPDNLNVYNQVKHLTDNFLQHR